MTKDHPHAFDVFLASILAEKLPSVRQLRRRGRTDREIAELYAAYEELKQVIKEEEPMAVLLAAADDTGLHH
jgi:hypothetical protein